MNFYTPQTQFACNWKLKGLRLGMACQTIRTHSGRARRERGEILSHMCAPGHSADVIFLFLRMPLPIPSGPAAAISGSTRKTIFVLSE